MHLERERWYLPPVVSLHLWSANWAITFDTLFAAISWIVRGVPERPVESATGATRNSPQRESSGHYIREKRPFSYVAIALPTRVPGVQPGAGDHASDRRTGEQNHHPQLQRSCCWRCTIRLYPERLHIQRQVTTRSSKSEGR